MPTNDEIQQYNAELDKALLDYANGNHRTLHEFMSNHNIPQSPHPVVRHATALKSITARTTLPIEIRRHAKLKLRVLGMESLDDGDL